MSAVKPDPPTDVWVSPDVMSLLVKWSHPPTWTNLDIIPLKYHVMYQWDNRGTPKSVKVRARFIKAHGDTATAQVQNLPRNNVKLSESPSMRVLPFPLPLTSTEY